MECRVLLAVTLWECNMPLLHLGHKHRDVLRDSPRHHRRGRLRRRTGKVSKCLNNSGLRICKGSRIAMTSVGISSESRTTTSRLCEACKSIFGGHWAAVGELETRDDEAEDDAASKSGASEDNGFYEQPDWVHADDQQHERQAVPRVHHTIRIVQQSAAGGCPLCTLLQDQNLDKIAQLDATKTIEATDAVGIAIVRPHFDELRIGVLTLQFSYFVGGQHDRADAYVPLPIDLTLLPCDGKFGGRGRLHWRQLTTLEGRSRTGSDDSSSMFDRIPTAKLVQRIKSWTNECGKEHALCRHEMSARKSDSLSNFVPTRLLDLEEQTDVATVRLKGKVPVGAGCEYVTLSHCWGGELPVRLLTTNIIELQTSIVIAELPRTFQDAILFTRQLRVRYLWIDALCIIQDSPEDWLRESLSMASVYSYALLNIASTSATDGQGGLFHDKNAELISPCIINASWTGHRPGFYLCHDPSAWARRVDDGPLNKRAWVFQERILAPRTVHFARDQIWWECRTSTACEAFPDGMPDELDIDETKMAEVLTDFDDNVSDNLIVANEGWLNQVRTYSSTAITEDADRLIALAGIASFTARTMGWSAQDYLAGIWRHDLEVDLLWRVAGIGSRQQNGATAPSWSWASVNGEVYFHSSNNRENVREHLVVNIVDAETDNLEHNFGPAPTGKITIQGLLRRVKLSCSEVVNDQPSMTRLTIGTASDLLGEEDFTEALDDVRLYGELGEDVEIEASWCSFMTSPSSVHLGPFTSEGLLLQEAVNAPPGYYQRIGWMRLFHHEYDAWRRDSEADGHSMKYLPRGHEAPPSFVIV